MRKLAAFALTAMISSAVSAGETIKRGAAINPDTPVVELRTVLEKPQKYTKASVVVEGVVTKACSTKGCWMQLAPADADGGVRVTFKDYGFFVPKDSKGYHARIEGVTAVKKLSKKEAEHLEGEGAKLSRNADGTANEVSFIATGVELHR